MELGNNKTDYAVALSKIASSIIFPELGFLGEIIGNVIPNQRIDRIAKYVKQLDERLSSIPLEKLNKLVENEQFIDLIEESCYMSARIMSDERREYIINIIANGIEEEELDMIQSKQLLKILNELNDIEVILLRYHLHPTIEGDEEFREKHKNLLNGVNKYSHKDEKEFVNYIMKESYTEHLDRLGLINHIFRLDKNGQPIIDRITGKPETRYIRITTLGKLLLKKIGFSDEIEIYRKPIQVNRL
ncbi:Abi-alpha family protein [Flavobacterium sp. MAHUQ-51]|uniref:Abi-alpha family protein n=1 Tax=Flavobacterium sp. GCM10022190 TaxID=3252639 RepID=UPI00360ACD13